VSLILVGLNHQTAPVALREQFYLADNGLRTALETLHGMGLQEVVVLSTCNRLEIFGWVDEAEQGFNFVTDFLDGSQKQIAAGMLSYLYFLEGQEAIRHLVRVACGLESLILGETQILGQVARSLREAQTIGTSGTILSRLFTEAIHAGKRARTETTISRHTLSVSHAAVSLIKRYVLDLSSAKVLVVGVGEMAELAVKALQMHNVSNISVVNRTDAKAHVLAERVAITKREWHELPSILSEFDVVITATGASQPVIRAGNITALSSKQENVPPILVDLGVPRNIDPLIRSIPGIQLYDIDDLQGIVDAHLTLRQSEIEAVETIVDEVSERYEEWLRIRRVVPLITEFRGQASAIAQREIEQTLNRLPDLSLREQEIVTQLAHRIVNKMLHAPTVGLKSRAASGKGNHYDYMHAVRQLFALNESPNDEHPNHE
jgi:glutamyl-tRNA reductase